MDRVIYQLTEKQLHDLVYTLKNYGRSAEEEQEPTKKELKNAKAAALDFFEALEERLSEVI